jgi:lipid-A-disaccharide synthase
MHIFFSVGEPSGDQHAAHLIQALRRRRPDLVLSGYGGPHMREAGCRLDCELTNLAVMGVFAVIPLLWTFFKLVRDAGRLFRENRPDAVVLVDFPGFNWWIARKAKAAGIPVFYYLPPQLWAWASWRVRRMRKFVDHILCGLPFEPEWYAERGLTAEYVGHPFFDEAAEYKLDQAFCRPWFDCEQPIVGILPGSRNHEVEVNFPLQIRIMERVAAKYPHVQFLVACYKDRHLQRCREMLDARGGSLPVELCLGRTPEIVEVSSCCVMVSGSVSLEMLVRAKPAIVVYRVGPFTYGIFRTVVRVKSMTLPNLIARQRLLPEWCVVFRPERDVRAMSAVIEEWIGNPLKLAQATRDLRQLRDEIVKVGATARTADCILSHLAPPDHSQAGLSRAAA